MSATDCFVPTFIDTPVALIYMDRIVSGEVLSPDFWAPRLAPYWLPLGDFAPPRNQRIPYHDRCIEGAQAQKDNTDDTCAEIGVVLALAQQPVAALTVTGACLWYSARREEARVMECVTRRAECLSRP